MAKRKSRAWLWIGWTTLILATVVTGYTFYALLPPSTEPPQILSVKNYSPYYPTYSPTVIPNLSIVFSFKTEVSLYILYTGGANITSNLVAESYIRFNFWMDDWHLPGTPYVRVGSDGGQSVNDFHSVTLQYLIPVLEPGTHNISVVTYSVNYLNVVRGSVLTITAYPI